MGSILSQKNTKMELIEKNGVFFQTNGSLFFFVYFLCFKQETHKKTTANSTLGASVFGNFLFRWFPLCFLCHLGPTQWSLRIWWFKGCLWDAFFFFWWFYVDLWEFYGMFMGFLWNFSVYGMFLFFSKKHHQFFFAVAKFQIHTPLKTNRTLENPHVQ